MSEGTYEKGVQAEKIAAQYLEKNNITILDYRYRTPYGEIDLIGKDQDYLVAIEVKYRKSQEEAAYALNTRQQKRIEESLLHFWQENESRYHFEPFFRFDVILICQKNCLTHIPNAWTSI